MCMMFGKIIYNTLMLRDSRINHIKFIVAVNPKNMEFKPACKNCRSIFKESFRFK